MKRVIRTIADITPYEKYTLKGSDTISNHNGIDISSSDLISQVIKSMNTFNSVFANITDDEYSNFYSKLENANTICDMIDILQAYKSKLGEHIDLKCAIGSKVIEYKQVDSYAGRLQDSIAEMYITTYEDLSNEVLQLWYYKLLLGITDDRSTFDKDKSDDTEILELDNELY